MSTNIQIQRICDYCGGEFTAKTTVTKYCSHRCNSRHYKQKQKQAKVQASKAETRAKVKESLKDKEYLTVRQTAQLLGCSVRTVYRQVETGVIPGVNLGERMTRIKRTELDKLFAY